MKKNICLFVTALDTGGIENYILRFLKEHHQDFNIIYIYCKSGRDGVLDNEFSFFSNVTLVKNKISYLSVFDIITLRKFLRSKKIDAVCDFNGSFGAISVFAAYFAKTPIRLVFYRNSREKYTPSKLKDIFRKFLEKFILRYSTMILSNSYAALDYFYPKRKSSKKFQVIYNGVNISDFNININQKEARELLSLPQNGFLIGHVGRYDSQKNHGTILEVAKRLIPKYDNIWFLLVGRDVDTNLEAIVKDPIFDNRIKVFGNRNDINKLLKSCDLFFFPSTIEGNPNALIEAMVSNLPIVSSNIDAIKEAVPEPIHQFLKDPLDSDGFAELLEKAYLNENFRSELQTQEWAIKNFNSKDKFKEFYARLTELPIDYK